LIEGFGMLMKQQHWLGSAKKKGETEASTARPLLVCLLRAITHFVSCRSYSAADCLLTLPHACLVRIALQNDEGLS
jgi:hypothetical protein